jgi:plasmid stability protein
MPDLLIRNLTPELHARLKAAAAAHRRSLTQEAIRIIEKGLESPYQRPGARPLPEPIKLKGPPLTNEQILAMIDEGQETRGHSIPENYDS